MRSVISDSGFQLTFQITRTPVANLAERFPVLFVFYNSPFKSKRTRRLMVSVSLFR